MMTMLGRSRAATAGDPMDIAASDIADSARPATGTNLRMRMFCPSQISGSYRQTWLASGEGPATGSMRGCLAPIAVRSIEHVDDDTLHGLESSGAGHTWNRRQFGNR